MTAHGAYLAGYADGLLVLHTDYEPTDRSDVPDDLCEVYADGYEHARNGKPAQPPTL